MGKLPNTGAAGTHSARLAVPTFEALIICCLAMHALLLLIIQHCTTLPSKLPAVFASPRINLKSFLAIAPVMRHCCCSGSGSARSSRPPGSCPERPLMP
eukprot:scaffold273925_cov20-Prasinocladus_malaysianus.AAC.1